MPTRTNDKKNTTSAVSLDSKWMKDTKAPFRRLDREKQDKIIRACIDEFAEEGFETASTNRIAQRADVAKGSIFKYFGTKEKMFLAVISHLLAGYMAQVKKHLPEMPKGVLERYAAFMENTLGYFGNDMKLYRAFSRIMAERGGDMMKKIRKDWEPYVEPLVMEMLAGTDIHRLRITPHEFIQLFTWLDNAIDSDVMDSISPKTTLQDVKKMYKDKIGLVYRALKQGIYK